MAPKRALPAPASSAFKDLSDWAKEQVGDAELRAANLVMLKALGIFGGAIFIMRNFGEAFAA